MGTSRGFAQSKASGGGNTTAEISSKFLAKIVVLPKSSGRVDPHALGDGRTIRRGEMRKDEVFRP
ncbi:MAG: hypothetical protein ACRD2A_07610, partial [Vicinamibacterales bacterium]